nr:UDP-glycosyltransferase 91A1-like [Ipomoea batatas]GME21484.1 UDP-glycosyltransferase 91A1-like [Ipomoea batatas]
MQRPPSTSRYDDVKYLKKAHDGLREAMAKFLQESRPDWVFSVSMLTELLGTGGRVLASEFSVSTVFFSIYIIAFLGFLGPGLSDVKYEKRTAAKEFTVRPKWVRFKMPGFHRLYAEERRWIGRGAFSTYSSEDSRLFNDVVPKTAENIRALWIGEKGIGPASLFITRYDGNETVGYRGMETGLAISSRWETLATNLEEFRTFVDNVSHSEVKWEKAVGKAVQADVIPVLEKKQKVNTRCTYMTLFCFIKCIEY